MKSKFQNFDFGDVEVLSREEQSKVKGGYIPYTGVGPLLPWSSGTTGGPPASYRCYRNGEIQYVSVNSCPEGWNIL